MKSLLVIIMVVVANCYHTMAQNNLDWNTPAEAERVVSATLDMGEYIYTCDTITNYSQIRLYNIENMPWEQEATLINGGTIPLKYIVDPNGMYTVKPEYSTYLRMNSIVDSAFSQTQAASLNNEDLFIILRVSSTTGEVTDVYFEFGTWTNYTNIPIEVFREMEVEMKNELLYEITELGKSLTYSALFWAQCPKGREDDGLTMPENGQLTLPSGKLKNPIGGTIVTP